MPWLRRRPDPVVVLSERGIGIDVVVCRVGSTLFKASDYIQRYRRTRFPREEATPSAYASSQQQEVAYFVRTSVTSSTFTDLLALATTFTPIVSLLLVTTMSETENCT